MAIAALLAACTEQPAAPAAPRADAPAPALSRTPGGVSTFAAAGPVCSGTGAHDRHAAMNFGCQTCHPCGGALGIANLTLPGGTSTAGATVTPGSGSTPTTCTVACHFPFGSAPQPVAWNAGPLQCTSCHVSVVPTGIVVVSMHPGLGAGGSTACPTCHDTSAHTSGQVRFVGGSDGIDATCAGCHAGTGSTLGGLTPPFLYGWSAPALDWHGSLAGTGYGGSLLSPWARGQAALSCTSCHDAHGSANAFLFARTVNGASVPPGHINRSGVGAEALCESCHTGARHGTCATCHGTDPRPAGVACLECHGHEGIRFFTPPSGSALDYHSNPNPNGCTHCHSHWLPLTDAVPPVILDGGPLATAVTATGATITWSTDEPATSYVEYGLTERGLVKGDATLTTAHSVALTGLTPSTTYSFGVRTSDASRNVTLSTPSSFTTSCPTCVPAPTCNPFPSQFSNYASMDMTLTWNAVSPPDGDPTQYQIVVATDAAFTSVYATSAWISGLGFSLTVAVPGTYWWRVKARDAVHLTESPWSATQSFWVALNEIPQ